MAIWGHQWSGKTVQARCDNAAVVEIVNSASSKDMHLRRCLAFIVANYDISLIANHVAGSDNSLADALSRDNASFLLAIGTSYSLPNPNKPSRLAKPDSTGQGCGILLLPGTSSIYI